MLVPKIRPSKIPLLYVIKSGLAPKIKITLHICIVQVTLTPT
jgi:hypothetical protein